MGTQDSFEEAQDFVADYGTTFTMLWDPTFESWMHFGITGQPAGMLATADGKLVGQWRGGIPEDDVLTTIAEI